MKKMMAIVIAALVLVCSFAGCGASDVDITGRWESTVYYDSESVLAEFEAADFYEEEIALLDPAAMGLCDVVVLNEDLTYTITYDAQKSYEMVEEYYRNVFATFFEDRESLQEVYGEDFAAMSEAEFYQYYADMYGAADFDELIAFFVGTAEDYAYLEEEAEVGTYRITLNRIYFTIEGSSTEEYVSFSLNEDGTLTLDYTDSTVTYTKAA